MACHESPVMLFLRRSMLEIELFFSSASIIVTKPSSPTLLFLRSIDVSVEFKDNILLMAEHTTTSISLKLKQMCLSVVLYTSASMIALHPSIPSLLAPRLSHVRSESFFKSSGKMMLSSSDCDCPSRVSLVFSESLYLIIWKQSGPYLGSASNQCSKFFNGVVSILASERLFVLLFFEIKDERREPLFEGLITGLQLSSSTKLVEELFSFLLPILVNILANLRLPFGLVSFAIVAVV